MVARLPYIINKYQSKAFLSKNLAEVETTTIDTKMYTTYLLSNQRLTQLLSCSQLLNLLFNHRSGATCLCIVTAHYAMSILCPVLECRVLTFQACFKLYINNIPNPNLPSPLTLITNISKYTLYKLTL